ncbi:MAG TPA: Na-translocating system protein MpsC family protein [Microbacteriaceae bacterium]|jgi:hypothetical protein|nr:Na-translocating system protein MpsC family protein [Microbacteriaceae bacterium]
MATRGQRDPGCTTSADHPYPAEHHAGELTQITRAIVVIYKERFGCGPNFAHSDYAGRNAIVCLLEGTLTPVEKRLVAIGEIQQLQNLRQLFQAAAGFARPSRGSPAGASCRS